jgi:two-component system phosphate regulon sensor histidine kinase PhoR
MNKWVIQVIIGLMAAAVMAITGMQVYWIQKSLQINEAKFDKDVRAALNNTAQLLAQREVEEYASRLFPQHRRMRVDELFYLIQQTPGSSVQWTEYAHIPTEDSSIAIGKSIFYNHAVGLETINEDEADRMYEYVSTILTKNAHVNFPLLLRMDTATLQKTISNELVKAGVDLPFNFGIYSTDSRQFVLVKDYQKCEQEAGMLNHVVADLRGSRFRAPLFEDENFVPGWLFVHIPGKREYVWNSVSFMLFASVLSIGIILFCFGYTIRVIFQQKRLEDMKNDFINNMTHEFKTPIATISLATDAINNPTVLSNTSKIQRFATIIKEENKRMNGQVEKVLQMAQLDKKESKMNFKTVDVHTLIEQACQAFNIQVENKNGIIIKDLHATDSHIEADETHLTNVIHNLLDNANKYSPEHPHITIATTDAPNGLYLSVRDKGIGINKEARKYIFDKFYRVSTGNVHDVKGFGLGLSYVKAIITAHKGHIDVKSELGKGTEFILYFPRIVEK